MKEKTRNITSSIILVIVVIILLFTVQYKTKQKFEKKYINKSTELFWKEIDLENCENEKDMYKDALEYCQDRLAVSKDFRNDFCDKNYKWLKENKDDEFYDRVEFLLDNQLCIGVR